MSSPDLRVIFGQAGTRDPAEHSGRTAAIPLPLAVVLPWAVGSLHDCRRTFCTRTADLVPMHVLQQWSGHANISTTASFYLAVSDTHAQRVRAAFANANGKPDVNADVKPILSAIDHPQVDSKPPSRYRNAS